MKVDSQIPLFLDTESPSQNKNLTNSSKLCDCIFFLHPLHCLQSFLVFNHKAIRKLSYSSLESCVFRRQLKIKSFIFNFKKSNIWYRVHLCFSTTSRKLVKKQIKRQRAPLHQACVHFQPVAQRREWFSLNKIIATLAKLYASCCRYYSILICIHYSMEKLRSRNVTSSLIETNTQRNVYKGHIYYAGIILDILL